MLNDIHNNHLHKTDDYGQVMCEKLWDDIHINKWKVHIGEQSTWQWRLWSRKQCSNHDITEQRSSVFSKSYRDIRVLKNGICKNLMTPKESGVILFSAIKLLWSTKLLVPCCGQPNEMIKNNITCNIHLLQWFSTFLRTRTPWAFIKFSRTPCLKASSNCYQRSSHGVTNSSAGV